MSATGLFRFLGITATTFVSGCGANLAHPAAPVQMTQGASLHVAPAMWSLDARLRPPAGRMQGIYDFKGSPDGAMPGGQLSLIAHTATDSMTTFAGGDKNNDGTIADLIVNGHEWAETVVYTFQGAPDGSAPRSSLRRHRDRGGHVTTYDLTTTAGGKTNLGAVIDLTPEKKGPWKEQVLYSFAGSPNDGSTPYGALTEDSQGNLYGATNAGGAYGLGTVYRMQQSKLGWTESVLYSFQGDGNGGIDGAYPYSGVSIDSQGNLYGTASEGGDVNNDGIVYKLTPTKSGYAESIIHKFTGSSSKDGSNPYAGVCVDPSGNLWGTTVLGGSNGGGTVYELSPSKSTYIESVLWNFGGTGDGAKPMGGVIVDKKGVIYGTTEAGGASGKGTFFTLTPSGSTYTETPYSFTGGTDGSNPLAAPSVDSKGNIYVTASAGGKGYGAVAKISIHHEGLYRPECNPEF